MDDVKYVKKGELPRHIFDEARLTIDFSTIVLTGHDKDLKPIVELHGTGTLVEINGTCGILTARHVWHYINKSRDVKYISISLCGKNKWAYENKEYFIAHHFEEGIDICFILIPIKVLGYLKANGSFFPLKKCPLNKSISNNFLVLAGFPSETMPESQSAYGILYYFTDFIQHNEYGEWDEILLVTDYKQSPNLIKSFKGVSGGAVWGFRIYHKDNQGNERYYFRDIETYIAGVCYFQNPTKDGKGSIKAVGPKTIYGTLYNYLLEKKYV
ncbi:hypothetical protein KAR48_06315 [bacterium]|nr:hypothetical protein [bacterium]